MDAEHEEPEELIQRAVQGDAVATKQLLTMYRGRLRQMVAGDLNGDGQADLAGLAGDGSIWYSTNRLTWTNIPGQLSRLVARDLNGDNKADLAGLASNGTIWYTTDLTTWTNIPGQLNRLAGDD